jgi:hypothetical protein
VQSPKHVKSLPHMVQNTLVEFMQMKKAWKEAGVQLIQTK